METLQLEEFRSRIKDQNVFDRQHAAFRCPMCKTVQSIQSFVSAGVDLDEAEKFIGFSCVGRMTGAEGPRSEPDGKPCDWTLGGLFKLHNLEVIGEDGKTHPFFEVATPEEAQALKASFTAAEKERQYG